MFGFNSFKKEVPYAQPQAPLRTDEDRWLDYLYHPYGREAVVRWAVTLPRFRFVKAYGGFAGDGDALRVAFRTGSEAEVLEVLERLGVAVVRYPVGTPQPKAGMALTPEEFAKYPSLVYAYPTLGQPGWTQVMGEAVNVWVGRDRVQLDVADPVNRWTVSDEAMRMAQRLEPIVENLAARVIEPPQESRHCVCPRYYPELFEA